MEIGKGRYFFLALGVSTCVVPSAQIKLRSIPNAHQVSCGSDTLNIAVNRRLSVSTVAPDGSDFVVVTPTGPLTVSSAIALSDTVVQIKLAQPMVAGADVFVTTDTGTDGNVMVTVCGNHFSPAADTLVFTPLGTGNPQASFTYLTNRFIVNFNASASTADSLLWDFGDGSPPNTTPTPTHTYPAAGQYQALLRVFDNCGGEDSLMQTITVCDSLTASFSASVSGDTVILNANINAASSVIWDLGDGTSDTGVSVTHIYNIPGAYYVQMQVTNLCGDTLVIGDTVATCLSPVSSWTYQIISTSGSGMVVNFDGTASQNAVSWLWDFGDGATANNSLTPTHTYVTPGLNYLVRLSIKNDCGEATSYAYRLSEISLPEMQQQVGVYPNPASNHIRLECGSGQCNWNRMVLMNATGQIVLSRSLDLSPEGSVTIRDINLPPGSYLLQIGGVDSSHFQRLVIR